MRALKKRLFRNPKKNDLDSYEELEESAREMKQQDPGYFAKLVTKIIDNLQITLENVYIRLEDDISFPATPLACGFVLKRASAITTDRDWNFKFIENADEIHKAACLRNLSFFFDYNDNKKDVFIENIRDDSSLKAFSEFALLECNRSRSNRYVLNGLNMDLRLVLNKEPKKNANPQLRAELKIGGGFDQSPKSKSSPEIGHMEFNIETQQITIGMKLIEYAGMYSKFQTGVLSKYKYKRFSKEQRILYADVYIPYLTAIRKKQEKAIQVKRDELEKLELEYSLDEIKRIRIATKKALELEEKHEIMKMETEKKVKELENMKSSSMTSFKSFFGSSSAKEKIQKAKEEVEKYKQELSIEQEKQIKQEKIELEKELKELFQSSEEVNIQTALDLPDNFVRFKFSLEINEISFAVSEGTTFYRSNKLAELSIKGLDTDISLSKQTQKVGFIIQSIDIRDFISHNKDFSHLLESRFSLGEEPKKCLSVRFINDSTNPKSDLNLFISNNCQLVLCANFHTIFTLASKLAQAVMKEDVDIKYYKDFAQAALTKIEEYIQLGIVYAKDIYSNAVSKHFNINLSVSLMAPILIVPFDSASVDNSASFIADLGKIQMRSVVQRKKAEINYLEETRPEVLYDYYELMLNKFQLYRINGVDVSSSAAYDKHIFIRDLSLQIRLYNCLEPRHQNMPSIKVGGILNRLDIVLTDSNITFLLCLLANMQKEQLILTEVVSDDRASSLKCQFSSLKEEMDKSLKELIISEGLESQYTEEKKSVISEEKMPEAEEFSINPLKKTQEFMIHFDDINLDIGRTITEEAHYKPYASYYETMKKQYPGEAPYVTDIKLGINGFGGYGYMTIGGAISAEVQLFRMYMKDMQLFPIITAVDQSPVLRKMVDNNFEYILQNPKVEILTTRRVGDNYTAFPKNAVFFDGLVNSSPFKEEINQISIGVNVNLIERKANVDVNINEIMLTLPIESLRPFFYMMNVANSALPPPEPSAIQQGSDMQLPKISFDLSLHCGLKDFTIKLPINCLLNDTKIYRFSVSADLGVSIHSVMEGSNLLTQEMQIQGQIDKLGMSSQDGRSKENWTIIPDTQLQVGIRTSSSSAEDKETVEVTVNVFPIDVIIGFRDIQSLLECSENFQSSIGKYLAALEKTISSKKISEIPPDTSAKNISITKISAKIQKLRFMAINDRGKIEYPFAKFWLTNLKADINQEYKKENGENKNISINLQELCCEFSKPFDPCSIEYVQLFKEKKVKYTSLLKFGMDSIICNIEITPDNDMAITANLHRLYMQDNQILPMKISDSKYSYNPLLVPEFQYLIHNPHIEADKSASKGQLDVSMKINGKDNSSDINFYFSGFRIVLAIPTIREIILHTAELMKEINQLNSQIGPTSEPEQIQTIAETKKQISMNLKGKLENIELWVPEDALKPDTVVTKIALSNILELEQGVRKDEKGTLNIKTTVSNLALSLCEKGRSRSLLNKFDIDFEFQEVEREQQNIKVKIKPIEIFISLNQVIFFQKFADRLMKEIDLLPLDALELQKDGKQLVSAPEVQPATITMSVIAQLDLVKLVIENDLVEFEYPLLKIWLANMSAEVKMNPTGSQNIKAKIFEISLELGKMLNKNKSKYNNYQEYFKLLLKTSRGRYMSEECIYKEVLGLGINGLEFNLEKDDSENMSIGAKMWRLFLKDRQIKSNKIKENMYEYIPILTPTYQSIISNPQIEDLCSPLEKIQDPIEKEKEMRSILLEKSKSQLHVSTKLWANNKVDINANLEEFRVIFAAKTISSLSKMLKIINNLVEKIVPQVIIEKKESPKTVNQTIAKTTTENKIPTGKDSELILNCKVRNINLLLPESGEDGMEDVAKFSLTAGMQLDLANIAGKSNMKIKAGIESILLQYINNNKNVDTIIPITKIAFQMEDSTNENSQDSKIIVIVNPIEIDVAFRHIKFFTKTSTRILEMLPKLTASAQSENSAQSFPVANLIIMNIIASLDIFRISVYDGVGKEQYPWLQLKLLKAAAGMKLTESPEGGQKIINASVDSLSLEIFKKINRSAEPLFASYIEEFNQFHDPEILPYVKLFTLGFEKMKSDINIDSGENITLDAYLHRLFLKDSQIKPQEECGKTKFIPAIASDFQDIVSNPFIEENDKRGSDEQIHQLVINLKLQKGTDETTMKLHYSDFRIILAIPTLQGLIETLNISLIQIDQIMKIIESSQPELSNALTSTPPPKSISSKFKFSGEIDNIEIWIPQNTDTNKSRICQLSFTSKIGFNSVISPKSKTTLLTAKLLKFALIIINKNLIEEGHPLSEASFEQIIEPAKFNGEVRISEMGDTQKMTVVAFVEPITMQFGFRNIHFFTDITDHYQNAFANGLPEISNKSTEPEKTTNIPIIVTKVDVKIDPLTLSLVDDTGLSRQQLFKLLFSQISFTMSGTQLLDESLRPTLSINRDLINLHAGIVMEANFFNPIVSEYEPVLENWGLECEILQESSENGKQININASKMLNINCSQAMAQTASIALKKFNDNAGMREEGEKKILRAESMKINSLMSENIFTEGFIFENKLGYPIKFYVQTISGEKIPREEYEKFEMKPADLLFLPKARVKEIRKKQATSFSKGNGNMIREDALRISVIVNGWKPSAGIPIELLRPHSCVIKEKIGENKKKPVYNKLQIVCRVRKINMHKIVSFESSIIIANNTAHDITIYSQDPGKKDISDCETLVIKAGVTDNLPFSWYCCNYCLGIFCKKDTALVPFRIFTRLKSVFETVIGKNPNKELVSRLIPFNNNEEFIACDISAFKCNKISKISPVQYLLSLNSPLKIQNALPFPLQISGSVKKEPLKPIGNLKSQEELAVFCLDGNNLKYIHLQFQMNISKTLIYCCDTLQKMSNPDGAVEEQLTFTLFEKGKKVGREKKTVDELLIQGNCRPYSQLSNSYENFELREKLFEHSLSKKLILFAKQVIVNKTEFEIKLKGDKIPVYTLKPYSSFLFGIPQGVKIAFSTKGFNWCKPMEVTTVGITGAFTLQLKGNKRGYPIQTLDFGIKIALSERPFTLTTVITIVPRYIFVNNLSIPISFAQHNQKGQDVTLLPKNNICFNFFKAIEASERKIVIFDKSTFSKEKKDAFSTSRPFPIDDLDDFQVPYKAERENPNENNWCDPKKDNNMKRTVQVSINSTDDATLFITFSKPKYSDFNIRNLSSEIITTLVKETKEELLLINPGEILPLIWPDYNISKKRIIIVIGDLMKSYDITQIGKQKTIKGSRMFYHVRTIARNFGREMQIKQSLSKEYSDLLNKEGKIVPKEEKKAVIKDSDKISRDGLNLNIVMLGVGISVIDEKPSELLYISFTDLKINLEQELSNDQDAKEKNTIIGVSIGYIQIDNMLEKSYPIIFGPQRLFEKDKEKRTKEEDWEPLVQIKVSISENTDEGVIFTRYNTAQLQISEMSLFVDQEIIMNIVKIVNNIISDFQDDKEKFLLIKEDAGEIRTLGQICASYSSESPSPPDSQIVGNKKVFLEFLHLAAMKIRVTLRLEKVAVDPANFLVILEVLYSVVATISNISDAPIYFKELLLQNLFSTPQNIASRLIKNYTKQGIFQFYKLLGAIDLIGNPIGLIDKLGSGVFEFFNEPRKGFLKGPKEFAQGIGKGFKSLVTNVVAGGLNSVSRVTGSLYSLVKNVSGEKINENTFKKPDNIFSGTWEGVKGGVTELAKGATGIFTQPFKGAKNEGAKGFFKGLGKGLIGAITSPVTAVLKVGTSVTQGLEGTVETIGKGQITQHDRIRFPRYFTPLSVLVPYNEALSEGKLMLDNVEEGKYSSESLLLFESLPMKTGGKDRSMIIMTEFHIMLFRDSKIISEKIPISNIKTAKMLQEKGGQYVIQILLTTSKKINFLSCDSSVMARIFSFLPKEKSVEPIYQPQI